MRESKENIEKRKALEGIQKNVDKKSWQCLYPNCTQPAINSHLLQRNGILSNLTENGHLYELVPCSPFELNPGRVRKLKLSGIHGSLSEPLFCNEHDASLFESIETANPDWATYKNQLLFAYRSTCSELRKKQRQVEIARRIENSHILSSSWKQSQGPVLVQGMHLGIRDIERFKLDMEKDLTTGTAHFEFKTHDYPLVEACASAIFSPVVNPVTSAYQDAPLSTVFINIIPAFDRLWVIVGHHRTFADEWALRYVEGWSNYSGPTIEQKLTDLFASRLETWCISPSQYRRIAKTRIAELLVYWNDHNHDHLALQHVPFNLFR